MKSISAFEIIKIGIGPSSSHTMGPWLAASAFIQKISERQSLENIQAIKVKLYGSLALTGKGHGTDIAVLMGLSGEDYETIDTIKIYSKVEGIKDSNKIKLGGIKELDFVFEDAVVFEFGSFLPYHPNGMEFEALFLNGEIITEKYYSLGGGFIATEDENTIEANSLVTKFPCHNAKDILQNTNDLKISVSDLVYVNEETWRTREEIKNHSIKIWKEIKSCIFRGVSTEGILPGGLEVKRRAFEINKRLLNNQSFNETNNVEEWISMVKNTEKSFSKINKWISCFALAVNEENASFGRIVTAPTNGAAGVIPAVLMYAHCFENLDEEGVIRFLLVAGEIGTLFKKNATISAAVGGCQAEIGVSSAMAAAGLTECLGGTPAQVLMAAEIAMEHHLGLTCDPINGLVQVPCIERNSMGSIKAITAANLALESDPNSAKVSLDEVINTMWQTAKDMNNKYKETSEGGLAVNVAVNVAEC